MACSCGKKKGAAKSYKVTYPSGKTATYRSETEAKYQVATKGGRYEPN